MLVRLFGCNFLVHILDCFVRLWIVSQVILDCFVVILWIVL